MEKSQSSYVSRKSSWFKWYAVIFKGKNKPMLYVGKVKKRFLEDKDGPVTDIMLLCLKPKVGSGTILEDSPTHFEKFADLIPLVDVIAGPLIVEPLEGNTFNVPKYEDVVRIFDTG